MFLVDFHFEYRDSVLVFVSLYVIEFGFVARKSALTRLFLNLYWILLFRSFFLLKKFDHSLLECDLKFLMPLGSLDNITCTSSAIAIGMAERNVACQPQF
jgi:hypothetical protein